MGIRKRIIIGFAAIGFLLCIAGVLSYFELYSLDQRSKALIESSQRAADKAYSIIDCSDKQDGQLVRYFSGQDTLDLDFEEFIRLNNEIKMTYQALNSQYGEATESLVKNTGEYISTFSTLPINNFEDQKSWYFAKFKPARAKVSLDVKAFMMQIQENMVIHTKKIEENAHRANMQSIASLVAAAILMLIFFFMVDLYFVTPIIKITEGLKKYLHQKRPFDVQVAGKDEVYQLKGLILQLINKLKADQKRGL